MKKGSRIILPHGSDLPNIPNTDLELVSLSTLEAGATIVGIEVKFVGAALGAVKCDVDIGVGPS